MEDKSGATRSALRVWGFRALGFAMTLAAAPMAASAAPGYTVLYTFTGAGDGGQPLGTLLADSKGNLYGTTFGGGEFGKGTVFELTPPASAGAPWKESVLHSFSGAEGDGPNAGLTADSSGALYGTTVSGGASKNGVVFKLTPGVATKALYSFKGRGRGLKDGANPYGGVIVDLDGNLYGMTFNGGAFGKGAVFKLAPNGAETVLRSFSGRDGGYPMAGLIADAAGNLYGATTEGGASNNGVVFELAERPLFRAEMVIWQFTGGHDGGGPTANLTFDSNGNLYGTTVNGGAYGLGSVFKVAVNGNSSFPLHSFAGVDGAHPSGSLIVDLAGNLYGTTPGDAATNGTVFKIAPNGAITVLHYFEHKEQGDLPIAGLTADSNGNLYGTTSIGGASRQGTVFELTGTGFLAKPVPFNAIIADLAIDFGKQPNTDSFNLTSLFFLGKTSPGIKPSTDAVSLAVGTFSSTLPAGSLKPNGSGAYQFAGTVNGVALQIQLTPTGQQKYSLTAAARNANLSGTSNPVSVTLTIGANTGTCSTTALIQR
jgi:uncharacterized repeat protein (TIGR03803 family)